MDDRAASSLPDSPRVTEAAEWDLLKSRPFVKPVQVSCFELSRYLNELMDDRAASSLPVPLPPVIIGSGCADIVPEIALRAEKMPANTLQSCGELLASHFILFSMSVIVERESSGFPRNVVVFTW
jgi:hypothetical protein